MLNFFPQYFTTKAITIYVGALIAVNIVFFNHALPIVWWIFGLVEVISFFYFSNLLTKKWSEIDPKLYEKNLFTSSLIIRVVWVFFSYFFYQVMTGEPFEFYAADAKGYDYLANQLLKNGFSAYSTIFKDMDLADTGYATYLGILYMIFGNGLIIPRLIKALLGAYAAVLISRLATRNFGETTGRIAGIFYMLMPNLIYYTGSHLKEAEMVFIVVAFVERADYVLRSKNLSLLSLSFPLVMAGLLFFLRTALGATALFALFTTIIFSSERVANMGKRTLLAIWVLVAVGYFAGGRIATEVDELWQARKENQKSSMEWRANYEGGNKFSKYASSAVFAPLIFVIPFPSAIYTEGQENQQMMNGANYVKNILAFFLIFAIYLIIKENKWRDFLLIGTFMIGYLIIIALSAFAQSERFHQPALPFILVFAAYGVNRFTNEYKKYFTWWSAMIFGAIIVWCWFKLAGRGAI
jgi:hypothetical protein